MPQPTRREYQPAVKHPFLTRLSIAYKNSKFIARDVAPVVPVERREGSFWLFDKDQWRRDDADVRPPGARATGGGWSISNAQYKTLQYAWRVDIPNEEIEEAALAPGGALNLRVIANEFANEKIELRREKDLANTIFANGLWSVTDSLAASAQWSNYSTSNPLANVDAAGSAMLKNTGQNPMDFTLLIGYDVYTALLRHPLLINNLSVNKDKPISLDDMARFFKIKRILVGTASENTAHEGQTAVNSFIWGKNALLYYTPDVPSKMTPSAMYHFEYRNSTKTLTQELDEGRQGWMVHVQKEWAQIITGTDLGYYWPSVVA